MTLVRLNQGSKGVKGVTKPQACLLEITFVFYQTVGVNVVPAWIMVNETVHLNIRVELGCGWCGSVSCRTVTTQYRITCSHGKPMKQNILLISL